MLRAGTARKRNTLKHTTCQGQIEMSGCRLNRNVAFHHLEMSGWLVLGVGGYPRRTDAERVKGGRQPGAASLDAPLPVLITFIM